VSYDADRRQLPIHDFVRDLISFAISPENRIIEEANFINFTFLERYVRLASKAVRLRPSKCFSLCVEKQKGRL
jgi:hypothetical protein